MFSTEEKLLCAVAHLGIFIGLPIVAPLVVYILTKSDFVKEQAKQAMVFHIGLAILGVIGAITIFILVGFVILLVIGIMAIIFPIIATIKSIDGYNYKYPITGDIASRL